MEGAALIALSEHRRLVKAVAVLDVVPMGMAQDLEIDSSQRRAGFLKLRLAVGGPVDVR